ncbi:hypothetical protein EDD17DRAFT_1508124 [Pisolithus thermaeus]|nr:hypothetical protein EDD17DRAFT_1508124 [Pisolithus thermaeus]
MLSLSTVGILASLAGAGAEAHCALLREGKAGGTSTSVKFCPGSVIKFFFTDEGLGDEQLEDEGVAVPGENQFCRYDIQREVLGNTLERAERLSQPRQSLHQRQSGRPIHRDTSDIMDECCMRALFFQPNIRENVVPGDAMSCYMGNYFLYCKPPLPFIKRSAYYRTTFTVSSSQRMLADDLTGTNGLLSRNWTKKGIYDTSCITTTCWNYVIGKCPVTASLQSDEPAAPTPNPSSTPDVTLLLSYLSLAQALNHHSRLQPMVPPSRMLTLTHEYHRSIFKCMHELAFRLGERHEVHDTHHVPSVLQAVLMRLCSPPCQTPFCSVTNGDRTSVASPATSELYSRTSGIATLSPGGALNRFPGALPGNSLSTPTMPLPQNCPDDASTTAALPNHPRPSPQGSDTTSVGLIGELCSSWLPPSGIDSLPHPILPVSYPSPPSFEPFEPFCSINEVSSPGSSKLQVSYVMIEGSSPESTDQKGSSLADIIAAAVEMAAFSTVDTMAILPYSETTASATLVARGPTTVSGTLEILTWHSYFPSPTTNSLPTLTATLSTQTTLQKQNTSTSPFSPQTPPATSFSTGSDSTVIIGSSVGAAALLCSIAIIALLFRLRSYRRKFNVCPFERTRPTVSPVDRNSNAGIWGGDVDFPSEISDMPDGQEILGATASPSIVDVRPEEDQSWIARHEQSRELRKLYPAQSLGPKLLRTRKQEGCENRTRRTDDGAVDHQ